MTIVTSKEYYERVRNFVSKHKIERVDTTGFVEESWRKVYIAEDGSIGYEMNRYIYESVIVKGLQCAVKLLETEWFDTDNSESIFMYQRA